MTTGGWNVDTLLELMNERASRYEERFVAQEKAVNAQLSASEKAISIAETNAEKWRDNANEWRGAMSDREGKFVTVTEFKLLKERLDRTEGSSRGMRDMWGWIVAGAILVLSVLDKFK